MPLIYMGMCLGSPHGTLTHLLIESVKCVQSFAFLVLSVLSMTSSKFYLIAGYVCHGVWDALHHGAVKTPCPRWYIPLCLVYDWAVALALVVVNPAN
mmetsp:Transcript_43423/g.108473  ORF Transcript_43423/g.108473 Transcript_43423/m.108473 type:complete len:97 (-) Transcript_43423:115-405(-)